MLFNDDNCTMASVINCLGQYESEILFDVYVVHVERCEYC